MKTLEVYAGTQSFSKAVIRDNKDNSTTTVDILKKFNPTIVADVLDWDYKKLFKEGEFDMVWCSPPCNNYSKAKTTGVRNLELADSLVRKAFEIIDYLKPKGWLVENVGTGLLVKRMESIRPGLTSSFVDYCPYGRPTRKRTIIWSNIPFDFKLCTGVGRCEQMVDKHHKASCGSARRRDGTPWEIQLNTCWERDVIPDLLVDYIVEEIKKHL